MQAFLEILNNRQIAQDIYEMHLAGDTSRISKPGQFVNLKIDGLFLRRPISVCDWNDDRLTLIYKVVGKGTTLMSNMKPKTRLDVLMGLGNGFCMEKSGDFPLLIGGGVGVPPLYGLAKRLVSAGKQVTVILGFNTEEDIFYKEEFERLGAKVLLSTVSGAKGTVKGFVTDALQCVSGYSYFYACGPEGMLRAVFDATKTDGELSFEARMGCGFGACMGCSCETKYKTKRICRDGPVLQKGEIIW